MTPPRVTNATTPRAAARFDPGRDAGGEAGLALLLALVVTALLVALGLGVVTISAVESAMAGASRAEHLALAAADAAAERALQDLAAMPSWSAALDGSMRSTFSGGPIDVTVPRRGALNLAAVTVELQSATDAYLRIGADTPRWQLFAWGWLGDVTGDPPERGLPYVAVWVSDDSSETDRDPQVDRNGRIGVRAVSFGPAGAERAVELTIGQITDPVGVKVIAWRAIR